jgi:uncharacterized membrane protein
VGGAATYKPTPRRVYKLAIMGQLLDYDDAPDDALQRIIWLADLEDLVRDEIDLQLQVAYFDARLQGRLEIALEIAPHGRKTLLAMTRRENEARGRQIRWGDGLKR